MSFVIGLSQGLQPIASFNYGAGKKGRVKEAYIKAISIGAVLAVIAFLMFQFFPRQIISIFGDGSELYYQFAIRYFHVFLFFTFVNFMQPITSNFFTAIGKPKVGSGSYCISIDAARSSATLALYMDIDDMSLADGTYQVSYDMGIEENGEISWSHYSSKLYFIKRNNTIYAEIVSLTGNFTSVHKIYFDNIGISKANPTNALYIKYNSMSGTSMAAPHVSAATALLAAAYPNDSAVQRRNRLLNCVREVSGLSSYCMTGGILDLSKISSASSGLPACLQTTTKTNTTAAQGTSSTKKTTKLVTKITLNKKKAKLRYKKKLKLKATVKPKNATNKKVKWYVSNKKYAKVTQKGVVRAKKKGIGHTVKVYAKAKDKSKKKAYCKVRIYK